MASEIASDAVKDVAAILDVGWSTVQGRRVRDRIQQAIDVAAKDVLGAVLEMSEQVQNAKQEIERLRGLLKVAIEALEFYGDQYKYQNCHIGPFATRTEIACDGGGLANTVLAVIRSEIDGAKKDGDE